VKLIYDIEGCVLVSLALSKLDSCSIEAVLYKASDKLSSYTVGCTAIGGVEWETVCILIAKSEYYFDQYAFNKYTSPPIVYMVTHVEFPSLRIVIQLHIDRRPETIQDCPGPKLLQITRY